MENKTDSLKFLAKHEDFHQVIVKGISANEKALEAMKKIVAVMRHAAHRKIILSIKDLEKQTGVKAYYARLISKEAFLASKKYATIDAYFAAGREFHPNKKVVYKKEKKNG